MRVLVTASLLALTVALRPTTASAQDIDDIAAFAALTFTPTGGLVPLPPPIAGRGSAFLLRYGMLDFSNGGPTLHNIVAGGDFATSNGRFGAALGYSTCDGCDGNIMASMDYTASLTQGKAMVAVRPALGFSKPTEGSGSALSLAVSLPLGVDLSTDGPHLIPYLVPGVGYGRVSGDDDSESGTPDARWRFCHRLAPVRPRDSLRVPQDVRRRWGDGVRARLVVRRPLDAVA